MRQVIFRIERAPWGDSVGIRIGVRDERTGALAVAKRIEFEEVPEGEMAPVGACLSIMDPQSGAALQSMMDQLWAMGVRPADVGTAGHLAATQAHLADFRKIVAKTLGIEFEPRMARMGADTRREGEL